MKIYLLSLIFLLSCSHKPTGPQYRGDPDFHPKAKNPLFTKTHPVVCFDEGHNNLAIKAGNYRPVLELLESDGYKVILKHERFVLSALKECQILYSSAVLGHSDYSQRELSKRSAFDAEEIAAITAWVKKGGSLLVATDHRPMSNAASKLLEQFNIKGSIENVRAAGHPIAAFEEDGIFSINQDLMNEKSPIVQGRNFEERLKKIFFFYGEALQGPPESDVFLRIGPKAKIGGLDNDPVKNPLEYPAAALALKFQKGRVVVMGDGTMFTSKHDLWLNEKTGINRAGSDNIQMALNVFHWLSGVL